MEAGRRMDVAVAEALGWKRYGATRHGQPIVVLVGDMVTLYDRFILSQGDAPWRETQDPLTADGARMVPRFSTDIAAAWEVVEHLGERFAWLENGWQCCISNPDGPVTIAQGKTAPEAICMCALKALREGD